MNASGMISLDLRGLEPPEPMVRILEAISSAGPGTRLDARLERRPAFLLDELQRRRQPYDCSQQPDGSWRVILTVATAPSAP